MRCSRVNLFTANGTIGCVLIGITQASDHLSYDREALLFATDQSSYIWHLSKENDGIREPQAGGRSESMTKLTSEVSQKKVNGKLLKNLYGVPETSNFSIY
jgi:hypothetical protein